MYVHCSLDLVKLHRDCREEHTEVQKVWLLAVISSGLAAFAGCQVSGLVWWHHHNLQACTHADCPHPPDSCTQWKGLGADDTVA